MDGDGWKQRWNSIGRDRRRAILRAIQRGEAVSDVRDARLAVELIDRRAENAARFARYRARFSLKHVVIFAVIGITLGALLHDIVVVGSALIAFCLWLQVLGLQALLDRLHARAATAREKNEELARFS